MVMEGTASQGFKYEDCLLKHYVRTQGWLPCCKDRRRKVNSGVPASKQRRLRYFTFCAVGAIDVLMLDVANVIRRSANGKFDTVVFFDKDPESVNETQKRIPGAIGFPGRFTEVVLALDPDENLNGEPDHLAAPSDAQDNYATRKQQLTLDQRRKFIREFPFDLVNLDLEEFIFKPNDPFPGKVVNALRKIFAWQRVGLQLSQTLLDGFTLMFTTQVGPPNISSAYTDMLREYLEKNLQSEPALTELLRERTGIIDLGVLQNEKFDQFFKLGLPKVLAGALLEEDWYVDPAKGITTFRFSRDSVDGPYEMLHLVMQVARQNPIRESRAPNAGPPPLVQNAYRDVARMIFANPEIEVTPSLIAGADLKPTVRSNTVPKKKVLPGGRTLMPGVPSRLLLARWDDSSSIADQSPDYSRRYQYQILTYL